MGRCFRCKTEYSSGSFIGGHEYCTMCYVRLRQDEDAKKKREQDALKRREEARRAYAAKAYRDRREEVKGEPRDRSAGYATMHPPARPRKSIRTARHPTAVQRTTPAAHAHLPAREIHWSTERGMEACLFHAIIQKK